MNNVLINERIDCRNRILLWSALLCSACKPPTHHEIVGRSSLHTCIQAHKYVYGIHRTVVLEDAVLKWSFLTVLIGWFSCLLIEILASSSQAVYSLTLPEFIDTIARTHITQKANLDWIELNTQCLHIHEKSHRHKSLVANYERIKPNRIESIPKNPLMKATPKKLLKMNYWWPKNRIWLHHTQLHLVLWN